MSVANKPESWAGVAQEGRRSVRRQLLLDAALDVAGTDGLGGVTVRAVSRQAGLNTRYFYENFPSVDDLLGALHDKLMYETTEAAQEAVVAATSDREIVRAFIHVTLSRLQEDPRRARVLYTDATSNAVLAERRRAGLEILVHTIAPPPAARDRNQLPYAMIAATMAGGAMAELAGAWAAGRLGTDIDSAVDYATDFMIASLGPTHVLDGVRERALAGFREVLDTAVTN